MEEHEEAGEGEVGDRPEEHVCGSTFAVRVDGGGGRGGVRERLGGRGGHGGTINWRLRGGKERASIGVN